ncbi:MAG: PD-(D/E)XK nuclease domain-containing protein [Bacteroidota bacterium]
MCCLASEGELDHYWLDSGGTDLIDSVLLADKRQADLQKLVAGESLVLRIDRQIRFQDIANPHKPTSFYSLLLFSGYLNPEVVDAKNDLYRLSIPNHEVGHIYRTRILDWVLSKLDADPSSYYTLAGLLASGQVLEFETALQERLHLSASFHQTGGKLGEVFYSGFMLCLLSILSSSYHIESERESGRGRADVVLIPRASHGKDQALVVEYKVVQDVPELAAVAEAGLSQISTKGYGTQAKPMPMSRSCYKFA